MAKNGIYAGIVSYNPEITRLEQNIKAIIGQVEKVVIFDNGSINQKEVYRLSNEKTVILSSEKNLGIAAALNYLMKYCEDNNILWMLSLDQDSICPSNYVIDMMPYLSLDKKIGIVAPVINDRNIGIVGHLPKEKYMNVNTCITSGAFVRVDIWKCVNGYDEYMFIDSVDFEFCYKVRKLGYKIIQIRDVQLVHELGNSKKCKFLFWKISINGHSAFRKYYISRNNIYYPLKHKLWLHLIRGNLRNLFLLITVMLYEADKQEKIQSIFKGWIAGYGVKKK